MHVAFEMMGSAFTRVFIPWIWDLGQAAWSRQLKPLAIVMVAMIVPMVWWW
jgi:hypothetical protein